MEAWIVITIGAAAAQTLRFMAQKRLTASGLSAAGATFARFLYAAPLAAALAVGYGALRGYGPPPLPAPFWGYAIAGGLAQILATVCVVALFGRRNFAVGITFKKTEVLLTAVAGFAILGDRISGWGAVALGLGFVGVLWLSDPPGGGRGPMRLLNPAAGLGLLSGVFFAVSAVGYRGAVLTLEGGDTAFRAAVALAVVTAMQTVVLGLWLRWRQPGQVAAVVAEWPVAARVGLFSMIGSLGWFAAFSLQNAAYVFAVGQVELIFSILAATLAFGERITAREAAGMTVITGSIVLLVALG